VTAHPSLVVVKPSQEIDVGERPHRRPRYDVPNDRSIGRPAYRVMWRQPERALRMRSLSVYVAGAPGLSATHRPPEPSRWLGLRSPSLRSHPESGRTKPRLRAELAQGENRACMSLFEKRKRRIALR
jgi:hypothetical protein